MTKLLLLFLLSAFGYANNIAITIDYGQKRANKKI